MKETSAKKRNLSFLEFSKRSRSSPNTFTKNIFPIKIQGQWKVGALKKRQRKEIEPQERDIRACKVWIFLPVFCYIVKKRDNKNEMRKNHRICRWQICWEPSIEKTEAGEINCMEKYLSNTIVSYKHLKKNLDPNPNFGVDDDWCMYK